MRCNRLALLLACVAVCVAMLPTVSLAAESAGAESAQAAEPKGPAAEAKTEKPAAVKDISYAQVIDLVSNSRGKVVIVNFWATWCAPCREEIPELKRLVETMPEDKLTLLGVSLDSSRGMVERFVERFKINYPVFVGGQDIIEAYSIMAIPRTVIYSPQGERVFSHEGYMNMAMLKRVVGNYLAKAE